MRISNVKSGLRLHIPLDQVPPQFNKGCKPVVGEETIVLMPHDNGIKGTERGKERIYWFTKLPNLDKIKKFGITEVPYETKGDGTIVFRLDNTQFNKPRRQRSSVEKKIDKLQPSALVQDLFTITTNLNEFLDAHPDMIKLRIDEETGHLKVNMEF
jgi:hypothetical protein